MKMSEASHTLRKLRPASARSIFDDLRLLDGRLLLPAAQRAGIREATLRARLRKGLSPDAALLLPVKLPRRGPPVMQGPLLREAAAFRRFRHLALPDGAPAWLAAVAAGVTPGAFAMRLRNGWTPEAATRPLRKRGRKISRDGCDE